MTDLFEDCVDSAGIGLEWFSDETKEEVVSVTWCTRPLSFCVQFKDTQGG